MINRLLVLTKMNMTQDWNSCRDDTDRHCSQWTTRHATESLAEYDCNIARTISRRSSES